MGMRERYRGAKGVEAMRNKITMIKTKNRRVKEERNRKRQAQ